MARVDTYYEAVKRDVEDGLRCDRIYELGGGASNPLRVEGSPGCVAARKTR